MSGEGRESGGEREMREVAAAGKRRREERALLSQREGGSENEWEGWKRIPT